MTSVSTLAAPPAADLWPGDQYRFADLLTDTERAVLVRLRAVLDAQVRPLLDEYWERGEFRSQVLPHLIALDLMEPAGALYAGFRNFELARTDCSVATMYNAQSGLFRTAVRHGGSPAQHHSLRFTSDEEGLDLPVRAGRCLRGRAGLHHRTRP